MCLIWILKYAVHLNEVDTVLKLAEYRVLLANGSQTCVCVVPGILTLAAKHVTALGQVGQVMVELTCTATAAGAC